MSPLLAGLAAGGILALFFVAYTLLREDKLVAGFRGLDQEMAQVPARKLVLMLLGGFVLAALIFGVVAGLVYSMLGTTLFYAVAFGGALVFSALALLSKTPMAGEKVIWTLAVGGVLGVLVPILAG